MITVAGGTGLVGKSLTQALVRDGAQVRVLTRDPAAASARAVARPMPRDAPVTSAVLLIRSVMAVLPLG